MAPEINLKMAAKERSLQIMESLHDHIETLAAALADGEINDHERKDLSEISMKIMRTAFALGYEVERYQGG